MGKLGHHVVVVVIVDGKTDAILGKRLDSHVLRSPIPR